MWYVNGVFNLGYGGALGDLPSPGDFNADGKTDVAVYRGGTWFVRNQFVTPFGGLSADFPLPTVDTNGDADPYQ
jgi:hypothetical protein